MLRRIGIKANVLWKSDRTGYILIPLVLFFVYAALSSFFDLPFPAIARKAFWEMGILYWLASSICTISLIALGFTLHSFGHSFRMGIDRQTKDKLITTGAFAYSRNPVFTLFITFFLGIFLAYPNMVTVVLLLLSLIMIHRQILQEESFLKKHYGTAYEAYCSLVRRYL
jgi:protein-S-isoprenylcysteine O-methyltransferase Ste14